MKYANCNGPKFSFHRWLSLPQMSINYQKRKKTNEIINSYLANVFVQCLLALKRLKSALCWKRDFDLHFLAPFEQKV